MQVGLYCRKLRRVNDEFFNVILNKNVRKMTKEASLPKKVMDNKVALTIKVNDTINRKHEESKDFTKVIEWIDLRRL